jgi:general secretion pathway protein G
LKAPWTQPQPPLQRRAAAGQRARGFTLIEMVVVLALVGILASAAFPLQALVSRRTQEQALRDTLRQLRSALDAHAEAVRQKRIAPGPGDSPWPASLQVLVQGAPLLDASGQPDGRRLRLLRRLPRCPFADTTLPAADTWATRHSQSDAPADGQAPEAGADVFDLHCRSSALALDGTAYQAW